MNKLVIEKRGFLNAVLTICILVLIVFLFLVKDISWKLSIVLFTVLLLFINQARQYCFKNYIRVFKTSIYIRFGPRKGFYILKSEINEYKIIINTLVITTTNNDCFVFSSKDLDSSDLGVLKVFLDSLLIEK